jgi:GAF domain-containing protein
MKQQRYQDLMQQFSALTATEHDPVANMANLSALLRETFQFWWVGFYLVRSQELVLGPFQGPVACTRILFGKGVCGTCWQQAASIIVPDVHAFPGHIACSAVSASEIVVPLISQGQVIGVLDVDSEHLNHFDEQDRMGLEELAGILVRNSHFS